jgi:hypothetical protein
LDSTIVEDHGKLNHVAVFGANTRCEGAAPDRQGTLQRFESR